LAWKVQGIRDMGSTCGAEVKKEKKTRKRTKPERLGKTEVKRECEV
jgi:hypothetical protein